jgi:hypothetical protein
MLCKNETRLFLVGEPHLFRCGIEHSVSPWLRDPPQMTCLTAQPLHPHRRFPPLRAQQRFRRTWRQPRDPVQGQFRAEECGPLRAAGRGWMWL